MRVWLVLGVLGCAAAAGCSSSATNTGTPADASMMDGGGGGEDAAVDTSPIGIPDGAVLHTTTLDMPPIPLNPGDETTVCITIPTGSATAQLVRHIHVSLPAGSHHLIFYKTNDTTVQSTPVPCRPFSGVTGSIGGAVPLFIAQSTESDLNFPDNVALALDANQMVRIEEHFINVGSTPIMGTGHVTLSTIDPVDGVTRANLMFWGNTDISIPPHSTASVGMYHHVNSDVRVFGFTAHEHHYGTLTTISQTTGMDVPGTELYRNNNWAEPPLRQFDPALSFDGTNGLALHCEYNNTSDSTVTFGESAATNEMCFFWSYYYPSHGFDVCIYASGAYRCASVGGP